MVKFVLFSTEQISVHTYIFSLIVSSNFKQLRSLLTCCCGLLLAAHVAALAYVVCCCSLHSALAALLLLSVCIRFLLRFFVQCCFCIVVIYTHTHIYILYICMYANLFCLLIAIYNSHISHIFQHILIVFVHATFTTFVAHLPWGIKNICMRSFFYHICLIKHKYLIVLKNFNKLKISFPHRP